MLATALFLMLQPLPQSVAEVQAEAAQLAREAKQLDAADGALARLLAS